ncbi:MAG: hypothetical protein ACOVO5_00270 [Devosia sp.]
MRVIQTSVALLAAAALVSSMATPALSKSKPRPQQDFFESISNFFGGSHGGGGNGGGHHKNKTYNDIPGTAAIPPSKATNTIVYFGTCNNLAGIQQAGNADADGFCLPFESLVGNEGGGGSPGSGPSCAVTTKSKSWSQPSGGEGRYGGGPTWTETTTIVSGTCDSVKAAEPPKWQPKEDNPPELPPLQ